MPDSWPPESPWIFSMGSVTGWAISRTYPSRCCIFILYPLCPSTCNNLRTRGSHRRLSGMLRSGSELVSDRKLAAISSLQYRSISKFVAEVWTRCRTRRRDTHVGSGRLKRRNRDLLAFGSLSRLVFCLIGIHGNFVQEVLQAENTSYWQEYRWL